MNKNLFATLFVGAVMALPISSQAQGASVDHYSSRGYAHVTYLNQGSLSGSFSVNQDSISQSGRSMGTTSQGYATGWTASGTLVAYSATWNAWGGEVSPSNGGLKTPGTAEVWFSATRQEFGFGPGGIQLISRVEGIISAGSTLRDPAFIETTRDHDHYTMTLPGIGMLFSVKSNYGGKIGFEPTGTGWMTFTPNVGETEVLFAPGTAVNPASWMGWLHSSNTEVVRN